jgi:hypothetical protein
MRFMATRIRKRRPRCVPGGGLLRCMLLFIVSLYLFSTSTLDNPVFRTLLGTITSSSMDNDLTPDKVHPSLRTAVKAPAALVDHRSDTLHPKPLPPNIVVHTNTALTSRRAKLADGCYHVFLDCGSNLGVHGRFLFEPHKYPNSTFVTIFDEHFGAYRTQQNICVFAFEPNPRHTQKQLLTQTKYRTMGWRYHYMPYGVGDMDGNLTFYRNLFTSNGTFNEEHGFSFYIRIPRSSRYQSLRTKLSLFQLLTWQPGL